MAKKKKIELLTKKQQKELQKMAKEMIDIAANVIEDYEDLDFSELSGLSGSITQIHESSPFLQTWLEGDKWKKVLSYIPFKSNKNDTE